MTLFFLFKQYLLLILFQWKAREITNGTVIKSETLLSHRRPKPAICNQQKLIYKHKSSRGWKVKNLCIFANFPNLPTWSCSDAYSKFYDCQTNHQFWQLIFYGNAVFIWADQFYAHNTFPLAKRGILRKCAVAWKWNNMLETFPYLQPHFLLLCFCSCEFFVSFCCFLNQNCSLVICVLVACIFNLFLSFLCRASISLPTHTLYCCL